MNEINKVYNTNSKSDNITAYFFDKLNVDDLYTQDEFKQMSEHVAFLMS